MYIGKLLLLIILLAHLHGYAQKKPVKPNIVWITCEDISPYIGAYGDPVVQTLNIDQLAKEGIKYTYAFTTAGVCAPSRSAIITGMYQTSIGTQHMRTSGNPKYQPVPSYSAVIPEYVKCFPEYMRLNGYYTTNNEKQDYQFVAPVTVWDENGPAASYRNRPEEKPFFSVFNLMITHESQLFMRKNDSLLVDPAQVKIPAYYKDTETTRRDMARQYTNIQIMDKQVGEIIRMLKEDNLYDQTIIFFYSDHGGALPWMKREILDRGIHIPLIIKMPGQQLAGTINSNLISAVDFAPTVLSLAGIKIPAHMQGKAFLGNQASKQPRSYIFAARDRMDTEYDRVRAVRDKRFKYIYNYMPEKPSYQNIEFRLDIPIMKEILELKEAGQLNEHTMAWFKAPKAVEELYDTEADPEELHNLASSPQYTDKLSTFRQIFKQWTTEVGDMAATPEKEMITTWWGGKNQAPVTATPQLQHSVKGTTITCATKGASIGYRIVKAGEQEMLQTHLVSSWDSNTLFGGKIKNGQPFQSSPVWQVYDGKPIKLSSGDTLLVQAMRIGYQPASIEFKQN
jgi:N-sulfoglucosamine sulfohydrolase